MEVFYGPRLPWEVELRHLRVCPGHESLASTPRAGIARSERNPPSRVAKPLGATLVRCHIAWRSSRRRGGAVAASLISVLGPPCPTSTSSHPGWRPSGRRGARASVPKLHFLKTSLIHTVSGAWEGREGAVIENSSTLSDQHGRASASAFLNAFTPEKRLRDVRGRALMHKHSTPRARISARGPS